MVRTTVLTAVLRVCENAASSSVSHVTIPRGSTEKEENWVPPEKARRTSSPQTVHSMINAPGMWRRLSRSTPQEPLSSGGGAGDKAAEQPGRPQLPPRSGAARDALTHQLNSVNDSKRTRTLNCLPKGKVGSFILGPWPRTWQEQRCWQPAAAIATGTLHLQSGPTLAHGSRVKNHSDSG